MTLGAIVKLTAVDSVQHVFLHCVIRLMRADGPFGPGAKGSSSSAAMGEGAHSKGGLLPLHYPYPEDAQ